MTEKIDALFNMVANIAQEITGMKAGMAEMKAEITGITTRLDRIEQKVDVLVEQLPV
ncbi:MAG: hypothetical protein ACM3X9_10760 [Bacillota bacterium]